MATFHIHHWSAWSPVYQSPTTWRVRRWARDRRYRKWLKHYLEDPWRQENTPQAILDELERAWSLPGRTATPAPG